MAKYATNVAYMDCYFKKENHLFYHFYKIIFYYYIMLLCRWQNVPRYNNCIAIRCGESLVSRIDMKWLPLRFFTKYILARIHIVTNPFEFSTLYRVFNDHSVHRNPQLEVDYLYFFYMRRRIKGRKKNGRSYMVSIFLGCLSTSSSSN